MGAGSNLLISDNTKDRIFIKLGKNFNKLSLTKDNVVIAGNHQLAAARKLGWDQIAVLYVEDDELTAKAFALADNRTADLGTYDDDLLRVKTPRLT